MSKESDKQFVEAVNKFRSEQCDKVGLSGSNDWLCCPSYAVGLRCMFDSQRHNKCGEKPCRIITHKDFIAKT